VAVFVSALIAARFAYYSAAAADIAFERPADALELNSRNAVALRALASRLMQQGPDKARAAEAEELAKRSLDISLVNAPAFRVLGQVASFRNDHERARAMMTIALRLSRREAAAHVWMAGELAQRGRLAASVHELDLALRIEPSLATTIFPVMLLFANDPAGKFVLARVIRENPNWLQDFVKFVVASPTNSIAISPILVINGGLPEDGTYRESESSVIKNLISAGREGMAVDLFLNLPFSNHASLTSTSLRSYHDGIDYPPVDWDINSNHAIDTEIDADSKRLIIEVSGGPDGVAATKLLKLPPGSYVGTIPALEGSGVGAASARWTLECIGDMQPRSTLSIPVENLRNSILFQIDATCSLQRLSLHVSGEGGHELLDLRVAPPLLRRAPAISTEAVNEARHSG